MHWQLILKMELNKLITHYKSFLCFLPPSVLPKTLAQCYETASEKAWICDIYVCIGMQAQMLKHSFCVHNAKLHQSKVFPKTLKVSFL